MVERDAWQRELVDLDRKHIWRPYTSAEVHEVLEPVVVTHAEGSWLYTSSGERYLDANGSWWCSNLGHRHPALVAALQRQSESLMHCAFAGLAHEPAIRLAAELVEWAPKGLTRAFFSDNGSTAVEVGLKMAFQYWNQNGRPGRRRFIALDGAFHGDTTGAMSVSGLDEFSGVFGSILFDVAHAPSPDAVGGWEGVIDAISDRLQSEADEIAAVIVEPMIQGAHGMRMWPAPALRRLREITREHDVFLIADEVFTGFGRTGPMWACDHAGISPDILCSAKGLSGGVMPFSATLATERIYDGFRGSKERALMHGHTFFGNPLGAAVALEVLRIYREEDVLAQSAERAQIIDEAFAELGKRYPESSARSLGMVGALDLGDGGYYGDLGWKVFDEARRRGVILRPLGDTVYICPSLIMPLDELRWLLEQVTLSVESVLSIGT